MPQRQPERCPHSIMLGEPDSTGRRAHFRCKLPRGHYIDPLSPHAVDILLATDWNQDAESSVDREQQASASIMWFLDRVQTPAPKLVSFTEHHIRKGDQWVEDIAYGDNRGNY